MELATLVSPSRLTSRIDRAAVDLNQYGGRQGPSRAHARATPIVTHPRATRA
jgi:hypothetical protein